MKLLYEWLREFVDVTAPASGLRTRLALSGLAIDSIDESAAGPVLDAEVTANRPDCLGHYGVAREVAAIYRLPVKPLQIALKESAEKAAGATRVDIDSPDLCGRYTARILRGVKIQPSPDWLRKRLEAIGQNAINNVVDVTNYVMFELGQPLHAFDLDKLAERRIIVRRAKPGEKIRTLDGVERALSKDMCVIADASRAVAVAGVMGGADSEIGFSSRNILLESAWFDPISVRRASKSLGLRTEASYRFERGADPEMAETASRRAAQLIAELAGGEILSGVVDVYPRREAPVEITLARSELLRVMGADVPDRDIEGILSALGFEPRREGEGPHAQWRCRRPSWRQDVSRGIDLIEEVARHYGYDRFPPRQPPAKIPARRLPHAEAESRLRERLVALGYNEIVEIPLVDEQHDALFRPEGITPAKIGNPLAEDASILRSNGVVSMASAIAWNLNHGQRNLRLFEIGRRYELRDGQPRESRILTLGVTGLAREKSIHEPAREFTFADLKGDLDSIGVLAGGFSWTEGEASWLNRSRTGILRLEKRFLFGPQGEPQWYLLSQDTKRHGVPMGAVGQLARNLADKLKIRQDVFLAEIEFEPLLAAIESADANRKFTPIPRYPAVERDFSLVLADGVQFSQVAEAIRALEIPELQRVEAADLFRGGQIPQGKYSLMIRVAFQSPETTLTDAQVAGYSSRIVSALEQKLGASLRST